MTVALVIAGAESWASELAAARELCAKVGVTPQYIYVNDHIATFPEAGRAASLHPDKIGIWLSERRKNPSLPKPIEMWAHRAHKNVTHTIPDWGGSSSLFAVRVELQAGTRKIILCGAPMTIEGKHFVRHKEWRAATAFQRAWNTHLKDIAMYVRSFSGWTEKLLGAPSVEWLTSKPKT